MNSKDFDISLLQFFAPIPVWQVSSFSFSKATSVLCEISSLTMGRGLRVVVGVAWGTGIGRGAAPFETQGRTTARAILATARTEPKRAQRDDNFDEYPIQPRLYAFENSKGVRGYLGVSGGVWGCPGAVGRLGALGVLSAELICKTAIRVCIAFAKSALNHTVYKFRHRQVQELQQRRFWEISRTSPQKNFFVKLAGEFNTKK